MIATDEEALICDFAETYRIYDYRALPVRLAAIYANGLRPNARIMMKISGAKVQTDTMLLATIADGINTRVWQNSAKPTQNNRPRSILAAILEEEQEKTEGFDKPEDFYEWRRNMIGG